MKREIKFRGKRIDNGAWETGCAVVLRQGLSNEKWFIADKMTGYHTPVDASTVGQFTGLHDANGKEIYEGDFVKWHDKYSPKVISWFICQFDAGDEKSSMSLLSLKDKCPLEVIGNIHDNPELLKGGNQ